MLIILFTGCIAQAEQSKIDPTVKVENMRRVKFTIGMNVAVATLYSTAATDDFLKQLPLTLTFEDFASKEKISYPPKKLSTRRDSSTSVPDEGNLAYYAPWGNIAVFYKDVTTATTNLLILGKFDSGIEFFNITGSFKAVVEHAE